MARGWGEEVILQEILGMGEIPRPEAVVVVLDGTTLERSLYLLMQVLEFEVPLLGVVNMMV